MGRKRTVNKETIKRLRAVAPGKTFVKLRLCFPELSESTLYFLLKREEIDYIRIKGSTGRANKETKEPVRDAPEGYFSFSDYRVGYNEYKLV